DNTHIFFFCSSRRRHTRSKRDWSSDVCSSDLKNELSINKLLALLNAHNISLYDFFEEFDEENLSKIKLEKQVYTAFNNRNINQLRTIKRNLNNKDRIESLKINLMLATLNHHVYEI